MEVHLSDGDPVEVPSDLNHHRLPAAGARSYVYYIDAMILTSMMNSPHKMEMRPMATKSTGTIGSGRL